MSDARQSDIEIYVAAPSARIVTWLNQRCAWSTPLTPMRRGGMATHRGEALVPATGHDGGAGDIGRAPALPVPVLVVEDAADGFTSVLFDSPAAPWVDDLACAKEVAVALDCEVRCTDGSWQDGQAEDEGWLSVSPAGTRPIRWKPA